MELLETGCKHKVIMRQPRLRKSRVKVWRKRMCPMKTLRLWGITPQESRWTLWIQHY